MTIQQSAVDLTQPAPDEKRRFPVFSKRNTSIATVLALLAWTVVAAVVLARRFRWEARESGHTARTSSR